MDIALLPAADYWAFARRGWPAISLSDVEMMKATGIILKSVFSIWGKSYHLASEWVEEAVAGIAVFDERLVMALAKIKNL